MHTVNVTPTVTLSTNDTAQATRDGRPVYAWSVTVGPSTWRGQDLCGPTCGPEPTERTMCATLAVFLGAALEGAAYERRTGRESDNADLFPSALLDALDGAGVDSDTIALLADEIRLDEAHAE